ncbi:glucose dehydrogenase [Salipiger pacificus]|nr:glucose dehydrogenase [Alloyangia pacifica]
MSSPSRPSSVGWCVKLLGWVCVLLGLVLLAGGLWLIFLGGSWYYALAGLGLILTGTLLNRGSMMALWLYLLVWTGTLGWALWESGSDWWAQLPRMLSPTVILLLMLACIPTLSRHGRRPS